MTKSKIEKDNASLLLLNSAYAARDACVAANNAAEAANAAFAAAVDAYAAYVKATISGANAGYHAEGSLSNVA